MRERRRTRRRTEGAKREQKVVTEEGKDRLTTRQQQASTYKYTRTGYGAQIAFTRLLSLVFWIRHLFLLCFLPACGFAVSRHCPPLRLSLSLSPSLSSPFSPINDIPRNRDRPQLSLFK